VDIAASSLAPGCRMLMAISATSALLLALIGGLLLLRKKLLSTREVGETGTWDCGYARPTARMQYTGSSFAQPITDFFSSILRTHKIMKNQNKDAAPQIITDIFPAKRSFHTHTPDVCTESGYRPLFRLLDNLLERLHVLQAGSIHLYILYIAVTLIALLVWKLS
jgi:hydrogenase-4 component B